MNSNNGDSPTCAFPGDHEHDHEMCRDAVVEALSREMDAVFNRELLRHAVSKMIFCASTGKVLDISTAVLVTIVTADQQRSLVLDGEAWDGMAERTQQVGEKYGATFEVIDGRTIKF